MSDWDDTIDTAKAPSGPGCEDCEADGGWWFHLRRCAACGHIGCCDQSLGHHATSHAEGLHHRYMRSYEPGEEWGWDYERQVEAEVPRLAEPEHHPSSQPTPGPADRVPADWQEQLVRAGLA